MYNVLLNDKEKSQNKSKRPVFKDILNAHIKSKSNSHCRSVPNKDESFPSFYKPVTTYNPLLANSNEIKHAELEKFTAHLKIGLIMLTVTLILTWLALAEEYYMMGSFI